MIETKKNRGPLPALLAAALLLGAAWLAQPEAASAAICPSDHPLACLARCRLHKAECFAGCRARKLECLAGVRARAHACRLQCRVDGGTPEEIAACKRRCTVAGVAKAVETCRLGKPVCVRLCHPKGCGELCGLREGNPPPPSDGADSTTTTTLDTTTTTVEPPICEPPVDPECLGACARDLRDCSSAVRENAEACLADCADLRGRDRLACVGDCVATARDGAHTCGHSFRECSAACGVDVDSVDPDGVLDPAPAAAE